MGDLDDMVKDFLIESYDNLDKLDRQFLLLEQSPTDKELLAGSFRAVHTIKGTSGFFGFNRLQAVCHAGETLMSKLRDGVLVMDGDMSTGLMAMVDRVRALLATIEQTNGEGEGDDEPLIRSLLAMAAGTPAPAANALESRQEESVSTKTSTTDTSSISVVAEPVTDAHPVQAPPAQAAAPAQSSVAHKTAPVVPASANNTKKISASESASPSAPEASVADSTVRIDVKVLDQLMNLVGELVLSRNRILQEAMQIRKNSLSSAAGHLDQLTTGLQAGPMKTRLQPIGGVWSKLPRVVRDLSKSVGKNVKVEMVGADTELDKTIIEAIKDPLTHMVRNSVDHGLEKPEARVAAGKPAEGTIILKARHDGGQVVIEIEDDGRGIDPAKIRSKAVEKGVITADQAAHMNDRDAVNLIFAAGFSTAEQVTSISGRGVGMDVVRTNIESIGGTVDILSRPGFGTTVVIRIPLTLAIIPALLVECSNERFAIPQVSLLELLSIQADKVKTQIEHVAGAQVLRLRNRLLPLVSLSKILSIPTNDQPGPVRIVVLQADHRQFGLVVDAVRDTQEIVVKPLANLFDGVDVYSGATIMGDGRVALILDPVGVAKTARIASAKGQLDEPVANKRATLTPMLWFRSPDDGRMAIPLHAVSRLEEIPTARIEHLGGQEVVQYRGGIMPLVRVFELLPERRIQPRDPAAGVVPDRLPVVVLPGMGEPIGLVVGQVLDTVEEDLTNLRPPSRVGIRGSCVIRDKVTEILDLDYICRHVSRADITVASPAS